MNPCVDVNLEASHLQYAEKHKLFNLTKRLLNAVILDKPVDPLTYLIDFLKQDSEPSIFIIGPAYSGKWTLGNELSKHLRCVHITSKEIEKSAIAARNVKNPRNEGWELPPESYSAAIKDRLKMNDCKHKGFVLSGFPKDELQAKSLNIIGIHPNRILFLEAPSQMLVERAPGRCMDPTTQIIYHKIFMQPLDPNGEITSRLIEEPKIETSELKKLVEKSKANCQMLKLIYEPFAFTINADCQIKDVVNQALTILTVPEPCTELRLPRVVLLGLPGSGRTTISQLLAKKYDLVDVDVSIIIRKLITQETKEGLMLNKYISKGEEIPDLLVAELIKAQLKTEDCAKKGWILHGYPKNLSQTELLDSFNLSPNRVLLLECCTFTAMERISNRRINKVTGERFHLTMNPPMNNDDEENLVQHPKDSEEKVKKKIIHYTDNINDIISYYGNKLKYIDAEADIYKVFEQVDFHVSKSENPNFIEQMSKESSLTGSKIDCSK